MAEESYEGASEEVQRIYKSLESAADVTRQETSSVYGTSNLKLYSVAIPINPLLPKTKENLNSGALIQARLGRIAPQGPPPFGKRYISIQAYSLNAFNDNSQFLSFGYDRGLQVKVTKKPANGSGWDEVVQFEDVTPYNPGQWTANGGGQPNAAGSMNTVTTADHILLDYDALAFDGSAGNYNYHQNNGVYTPTFRVTFASGHVEEFDIPCPVHQYYYANIQSYWDGTGVVEMEQEVNACESNPANDWYSKGTNWLQSSNRVDADAWILTRFAPDVNFNPSGTLGEYGYVERKIADGVNFLQLCNRIDWSWGDFLVQFYGVNGVTTVDQFQTAKQVIKRIDVYAEDTGFGGLASIDSHDFTWFTTNYQPHVVGGETVYIDDNFTGIMTTSYQNVVDGLINQNQVGQYFTSTFYYSENITACGSNPNASYTVCDDAGNPSHYTTTGVDCSLTTIPTADLPGGSNYSNVTFIHDQACCTVCTLTATFSSINATFGVNDGVILWDATSGGVPSGNPFSSGSQYTVTYTDSSGASVGNVPPTGGNTFTDATCDTTNGSSLVGCNSNIKIEPGMQVSGAGIPASTFVGNITLGTVGIDVTQFQLVDTLGTILNASATNTNTTLTFSTGHTGEHGGLAPNDITNPYYTVCITDSRNCQECSTVVVNESTIVTVPGCTDNTAVNYNASATVNDGSCVLCDGTTGLLTDPISGTTTNSWVGFNTAGSAATENSPCSTWNSDGVLSVTSSPALPAYLTFDANSKFEILLYKVVTNGDTSTAPGAVQIGGTINAGTLDLVSVAAHTFTGLAFGYYSVKFRYVDTNSVSTMEDCFSEFPALVKAEVCNDPINVSYCPTPADPLLRQANNSVLCTQSPPSCCALPVISSMPIGVTSCGGDYLYTSIDCDPARTVTIQWLYSPGGVTYTSLGTYSMGFVSGGPITIYAYSNNDNIGGVNWYAANGTGYYKVILTGTTAGQGGTTCVEEQFGLFTAPIHGCMDSLAHNYNPLAVCPGPCAFPSWDCNQLTGQCTDPWAGTLVGYVPGAYNCLNGAGCCNSYCSPPTLYGCTDSCATNYDPTATIDDGSCTYTACLDWPTTNQYQNCCNGNFYPPGQIVAADNSCCIYSCLPANTLSSTTVDSTSTCTVFNSDGSVTLNVTLNSTATSWTWVILDNVQTTTIYADSTVYIGSTSATYSLLGLGNYWIEVTDNLGCHWLEPFTIGSTSPKVGCTDPNASNYDPLAVCDCCCQIVGCLDPNASNYNPNANVLGQCNYILPPPSPCIPPSLEEDQLKIKACLNQKGTSWLNDYVVGRADDCSLLDQWKLILVDYLVDQGISCLFNCQDLSTPAPTVAQNCNDLWRTGGLSTGLNQDPNHLFGTVLSLGEGTTVTQYDNYPNGWFGRDNTSNPSNNFTYVGDVIKFALPAGHPLATFLNGTIWTLTTPSAFPSGIHNGCTTQKIQHYTQCLDMNTISITTNINYYDNFLNFVNKFCADCNISILGK